MPLSFPVKKAETILDYDYQDISGHTFLLPLKAQVVMAADDYMTRNVTEFRNYNRYSADTVIKFDTQTEPPPPLPDDLPDEPALHPLSSPPAVTPPTRADVPASSRRLLTRADPFIPTS